MSSFEFSDEMLVSRMQHTSLEQYQEHFFCSPARSAGVVSDKDAEARFAPKKTHISLFHSRNSVTPVKLSLIF